MAVRRRVRHFFFCTCASSGSHSWNPNLDLNFHQHRGPRKGLLRLKMDQLVEPCQATTSPSTVPAAPSNVTLHQAQGARPVAHKSIAPPRGSVQRAMRAISWMMMLAMCFRNMCFPDCSTKTLKRAKRWSYSALI